MIMLYNSRILYFNGIQSVGYADVTYPSLRRY